MKITEEKKFLSSIKRRHGRLTLEAQEELISNGYEFTILSYKRKFKAGVVFNTKDFIGITRHFQNEYLSGYVKYKEKPKKVKHKRGDRIYVKTGLLDYWKMNTFLHSISKKDYFNILTETNPDNKISPVECWSFSMVNDRNTANKEDEMIKELNMKTYKKVVKKSSKGDE